MAPLAAADRITFSASPAEREDAQIAALLQSRNAAQCQKAITAIRGIDEPERRDRWIEKLVESRTEGFIRDFGFDAWQAVADGLNQPSLLFLHANPQRREQLADRVIEGLFVKGDAPDSTWLPPLLDLLKQDELLEKRARQIVDRADFFLMRDMEGILFDAMVAATTRIQEPASRQALLREWEQAPQAPVRNLARLMLMALDDSTALAYTEALAAEWQSGAPHFLPVLGKLRPDMQKAVYQAFASAPSPHSQMYAVGRLDEMAGNDEDRLDILKRLLNNPALDIRRFASLCDSIAERGAFDLRGKISDEALSAFACEQLTSSGHRRVLGRAILKALQTKLPAD